MEDTTLNSMIFQPGMWIGGHKSSFSTESKRINRSQMSWSQRCFWWVSMWFYEGLKWRNLCQVLGLAIFFLKNARFWKYWNTWHHLDVELVEQQTSTATHQQDTVTATLYRTIEWWNMWEHIALSRVFLPVFIPQLEADNLTRDQNSVKQWGRVHRSKRWLPGD